MDPKSQFLDVRQNLMSALSLGSVEIGNDDLKPLVESPLPLEERYQEINAVGIILSNVVGQPSLYLQRISTALNILEKYGRNLLNPQKPKYWRSVKFNNPVFKTTVDAIKGGRDILRLYGYTVEQADGMSFLDEVEEPNHDQVASVTLDVTLLRLELNLLLKTVHPHPEIFQELLQWSSLSQKPAPTADSYPIPDQSAQSEIVMPSPPANQQPSALSCGLCGEQNTSVHCPTCQQALCNECDGRFHKHPSRAHHQRVNVAASGPTSISANALMGSPPSAAPLPLRNLPAVSPGASDSPRGSSLFPDALTHRDQPSVTQRSLRSPTPGSGSLAWPPAQASPASLSASRRPWQCAGCTTMNEARSVLCVGCDRPRACKTAPTPEPEGKSLGRGRWCCQACTFENESAAVLCVVCERPRLAAKPSLTFPEPQPLGPVAPANAPKEVFGWHCEHCTFWNTTANYVCQICDRTSVQCGSIQMPAVPDADLRKEVPKPGTQPGRLEPPPVHNTPAIVGEQEFQRQQRLREDGAKLINMIRVAEASGISPEEVFCAVQYSGTEKPVQWLQTELPYVLDTVVELTAQKANGPVGAVTHQEAKKAWLSCAGNIEDAALECINIRKKQIKEIEDLGFRDYARILQSLYINAGDVGRAVTELQRQQLEPFHIRIWQDHEPELCFDSADKQSMVRRILAIFSLPSWGRAELVLSLMQDRDLQCELQDVVEAVLESPDKEFIKRLLAQPCATCYGELPRNKMQSLTSCECAICPECFKQHFTIAVKEKHIKDMVCPNCSEPEINDEAELITYFSNLDILLRDCLDGDILDLFHRKLTERTLMKDEKFLWCTHCSYGFIYERQQIEAQCPQCLKSFCIKCKRPWEVQHQGISCEDFVNWKRENDPEYQKQGLAMYLQENGINCPHCKYSYALARGGCMHFICSQCRHQFCSGCYNTFFHNNNKCTEPSCLVKMTLHAHHPRDCLFYLRDWDVDRLQKLLKDNKVAFNTDPPAGTQTAPGGGCRVLEQKEGLDRMKDEPCGKETTAGHAGLCKSHYKEYLVRLINNHTLDPANLYDINELNITCNRYLPQGTTQRIPAEDDQVYCTRILKLMTDVPLGERIPRKN
ncbi:E3 ubiquitin-protein ligase RNF31 isoform X2 [Ambystoma mexicanum]|uniref:E3 ubiquitin-protein ligase RNF31 isoform X2 n=1 Tax=Ambystoma mexicanum TaxID=8296 RepID=UPI0037E934D4